MTVVRGLNWWVCRKREGKSRTGHKNRLIRVKDTQFDYIFLWTLAWRNVVVKLTFHSMETHCWREINHENGIFPFQFTPQERRDNFGPPSSSKDVQISMKNVQKCLIHCGLVNEILHNFCTLTWKKLWISILLRLKFYVYERT